MLEKLLHHKLLKEGAQGQGVVTQRHDQATERTTSTYSMLFEIQGHIRFPDGSQHDFRSEMLNSHKVGDLREGQIVPVRYDPEDHSKVVLDVIALEERRQGVLDQDKAEAEQRRAQAIAEADAAAAQANARPQADTGLSGS